MRRHAGTAVLINRRSATVVPILIALLVLGDPEKPFWPSTLSPAFVKTTFTLVLAAMSFMMFLMLRQRDMGAQRVPHWNARVWLGLAPSSRTSRCRSSA